MNNYICTTCGTQYEASEEKPSFCRICREERQYVNPGGQQWTTPEGLKNGHRMVIQKKEPSLYGIGMDPSFGIGQRALLLLTPGFNILWDCISLVDESAIDVINALGGLDAIAISHPHYYTSMVDWSTVFGDIPIYLHEADREWVQRPDDNIRFWNGDSLSLSGQIDLYNLGGHFEGGTVLHWKEGAEGKGAILGGDILAVVADRRHVTFMYSFPNYIPLGKAAVERMVAMVEPLSFDRIYGAFWDQNIKEGAMEAVKASADRYIFQISDES